MGVAAVMAAALVQPATAGPALGRHAPAAAKQAVGHYAALGDSYSSGLGIPTETNVNCGRSDHNYPTIVATAVRADEVTDVTCAGADTRHMSGWQDSAPPQLDALRTDTALVTLGIGGNDLDLPGVITRCVLLGYVNPQGAPCKSSYTLLGTDEIRSRINATAPKIAAALQEIHARSPQAKVMLVGYPVIFPDDGSACRETIPLAVGDFAWLRDKTKQFNAMLAQQAAVYGATYIDTYGPSVGHDACKPAGVRWIEPADTESAAGFHPNEAGHRSTADAVLAAVSR
ncbi:SGNH/GDSL hydrolase family protein [Streptomyces sp. ISL-36]|uniref:SGNH/GDSL hydrolase family protein n=1 Tax=Streptomyces sp. ISL-36 TaxID=2819182 RepID=UPI001BE6E7DF|nr:SGNH/GDSL hydrolase family protein [Streptomyces sp. ISL-36]MBT2440167.1 SGNH/GDSL hydrolase family protein [Streptomyces sp. ISL-36]